MANTDPKDTERGLYNKFQVFRKDGRDVPGEKHCGCEYFVLDLDHDPYAADAIRAYAVACAGKFPLLAEDLWNKARELGKR